MVEGSLFVTQCSSRVPWATVVPTQASHHARTQRLRVDAGTRERSRTRCTGEGLYIGDTDEYDIESGDASWHPYRSLRDDAARR